MHSAPQLSVIICSISPEKAENCVELLRYNSTMEIEAIVVDNRTASKPLAHVYNEAAMQASAPNLLFIHEDVEIRSAGWVEVLIDKLSQSSTGVIGFAGSTIRVPVPSGWDQGAPSCLRASLRHIEDGELREVSFGLVEGEIFRPVITLDGLALAVRREVWSRHPFDQTLLQGFHCYDIDFSVAIAQAGYTNYVMYGVDVLHLSAGSYNAKWVESTISCFRRKWNQIPPLSIATLNNSDINDFSCQALYRFISKAIKQHINRTDLKYLFNLYRHQSHTSNKFYRHLATLLWQYLRYSHQK